MAAYDEIADWYEAEFLNRPSDLGTSDVLRDLLGEGAGLCLEVGCGTGVHARQLRELGWTPVGVDLSAEMLRVRASYGTGVPGSPEAEVYPGSLARVPSIHR